MKDFVKAHKKAIAATFSAVGAAIAGTVTWWDAIEQTLTAWGVM
jgi:hypothetical protein